MSERAEIVRLHEEIVALSRENQKLRNESEIVRLVGVAPLGAGRVQEWGYTADSRWVSRIVNT